MATTLINGISEDLSPNAYAVAKELKDRIDALNAKDQIDIGEVVTLLQEGLQMAVVALARVEIEAGTALGRITER